MTQGGLKRQLQPSFSSDPQSAVAHPQLRKFAEFLDITDADRQQARLLWEILEPHIGAIVDRFYVKLQPTEIGHYVTGGQVERLKHKQRWHWEKLFASQFDDQYVCSVQRVGIRHRDLKLGSAWYVAGYILIKLDIIQAVLKTDLSMVEKGRLLRTVEKYVALDMTIALAAYENDCVIVD